MVTRKPVTHLAAVDEAVEAMATGTEHRAHVEACRSLAARCDFEIAEGYGFDDKLWREYRLALKALREAVTSGSDDDDDLEREFREAEERRRASMGNPA